MGYDSLHKLWKAAGLVPHGPQQRNVNNVHDADIKGGVDGKKGRDSDLHSQW